MKRILLILLAFGGSNLWADPLSILTTTTDLAHFVRRVGGSHVAVQSVVRASEDPHRVEARPDFILRASKADAFVEMGMDLETGWSPVLLAQSRNARIQKGSPGYCDASRGIQVLEKPDKQVDRSMGDVHVFGNPHYHTDPLNAVIAARNIRDMLIRIDPESEADYRKNFDAFSASLKNLVLEEMKLFRCCRGLKIAVYHREFVYYAARFGIVEVASIEEKPGVPPSAAYLKAVTEKLKAANVKVILRAPWNDARTTQATADRIGASVLTLPISVGSDPNTGTYEDLIRTMGRMIRAQAK